MRFEPARMAELRDDHATALAIYEDAAVDGIAYAQYRVAGMYESGLGTGRDYRQAARCTPPPRSRGMPERSEASPGCTSMVRGVEQDAAAALALYRKAVASGDVAASFKVGQFLERGQSTEPDPAAAVPYDRVAAEAGRFDARLALAQLYESGTGVLRIRPRLSAGTPRRRSAWRSRARAATAGRRRISASCF
jgi:uncharacterized protein